MNGVQAQVIFSTLHCIWIETKFILIGHYWNVQNQFRKLGFLWLMFQQYFFYMLGQDISSLFFNTELSHIFENVNKKKKAIGENWDWDN